MQDTIFWRTVSSVTFWFNLITGITGVLALPEVVAIIPKGWLEVVAVVNPVGNFLIRQFLTATPITRGAAERARTRAGLNRHDIHLHRRLSDTLPLAEEIQAQAAPRRRKTDTEENRGPALVGRTVTTTGDVAPTRTRHKKPNTGFSVEGREHVTRKRKTR